MHVLSDCDSCFSFPLPIQVSCCFGMPINILISRWYSLVCLLDCQYGLLCQPILMTYQHTAHHKFCSWLCLQGVLGSSLLFVVSLIFCIGHFKTDSDLTSNKNLAFLPLLPLPPWKEWARKLVLDAQFLCYFSEQFILCHYQWLM